MKKILAAAICSLPFALAPTVYAQSTTGGGAATGAPASTSASASPDASKTTRSADTGASMTPSTSAPAAATTTGDRGAMAATAASTDWSVKDDMIGEAVHNESDDKVGDITDVLVSRDGKVTAFVVGAGGFLGMGEHNVAIPYDRITKTGDKLILAGYTKDQLKEMPKYEPREKARSTDRATTTGTAGTPASPVTPAPGATSETSPPTSGTR